MDTNLLNLVHLEKDESAKLTVTVQFVGDENKSSYISSNVAGSSACFLNSFTCHQSHSNK